MKKAIATTLVLGTMFTFTSCGGSGGASEEVLTDVSFPLEETTTISVMTKEEATVDQDENNKLIAQRLEDETNVHVDWTTYVSDQYYDKRNLALAKPSSLPDVLFNAGFSTYDLLKYGEQGVIIPLNDLIDNYMPNLTKILDENPEYRTMITAPDGNIYAFPWIEQLGVGKEAIQSVAGMPFINKTWLDELGLPIPTTTDELEEALIAFKGMGEDVIPMSFILNNGNEDMGFLLGAFGYGDNGDHIMIDNDGTVLYSLVDEGYKEGIKWVHQLYEEGLIDPEVFTHDWARYVAKGKNNQYGMFFGWTALDIAGNPDDYVPLPALEGPDGFKNAPRSSGSATSGFDMGRCVITSNATQLELIAKWIDQMYAPIQSIQNNWGTYDDENHVNIFTMKDDGTLEHNELGDTTPYDARVQQMIGGPLAILNSYYGVYTTFPPDAAERMADVKSYVPDMKYDNVYPIIYMTMDDLDRATQLETDINSYGNQMKAHWILDGGVDEEWDEYLQKMDNYGLEEYIALKQKYYDEYMAS